MLPADLAADLALNNPGGGTVIATHVRGEDTEV